VWFPEYFHQTEYIILPTLIFYDFKLEFRKVLDELGDENKSVNMTDTDAVE
jgi:hypothetical protein